MPPDLMKKTNHNDVYDDDEHHHNEHHNVSSDNELDDRVVHHDAVDKQITVAVHVRINYIFLCESVT